MAYQSVFKRYELKYLLTAEQKQAVLAAMAPYMEPDRYGVSTVRSIYLDTASYRLVRRSLEKPVYKEKLRIRSYRQAENSSAVFVELKKKYKGIVYKRRLCLPLSQALDWLDGQIPCPQDCQIGREIQYFLDHYGPLPRHSLLSYQREAYTSRELPELRVTFDENILFRTHVADLRAPVGGAPLLPEGITLMELKCGGGIPLWMARTLSQAHIYKTSFSKYGTAYRQLIQPNLFKEATNHDRNTV